MPFRFADPFGGLKIGCQCWTFNNLSAYESVERTARAGAGYIEFFPGQKLMEGSETRVGPGMSDDEIKALLMHCRRLRIKPMAFGVTGFTDNHAENEKTFLLARKMGLYSISTEPAENAFDSLEQLVKKYNIRIAIHNHPRQPNNPSYRYWDPDYVAALVSKRDRRIGACADTGHWVRSGVDPVEALQKLKGRIHGAHLKELTEKSPRAADAPFGTGNGLMKGILDELKRQRVSGILSIEYETNFGKNDAEVARCVAFVREWAGGK